MSPKHHEAVSMLTTCKNCPFFSSDSWHDIYWTLCTHPLFGDEGQILPTRDAVTPEWCPINANPDNPEPSAAP